MADREHFLAAIRANPADDTVRLVYADWLEEQQNELDSMRAKLIRLGVRWPGSMDACLVPTCCEVVGYFCGRSGEQVVSHGEVNLDCKWKHTPDCPSNPSEFTQPEADEESQAAYYEIGELSEQFWKAVSGLDGHYGDMFWVYMVRGFWDGGDSGAECALAYWSRWGDLLKDDVVTMKVRTHNLRLEDNRTKDWRVVDSGTVRFFADTGPFKKGDTFTIVEFRERLKNRWPWVSEFIFDEKVENLITKAQAEREDERRVQAASDQFWFGVPDDVFN